MRRGHTLLEISAVLLLAALAGSAVLGGARRLQDAMAVVSAREAVAGLLARARVAAVERGGAVVRVQGPPWRATLETGGAAARVIRIEEDLGVTVALAGGGRAAELRYDALGLGRVASETLRFRRGDQERALVVSGYGRVRRP